MPTFVYMGRCDGCGQCVDICPSDIMHIDPVYRRAFNVEPNFCWECYSCVKSCPQHAIDVRGYADFNPLGHSVRVHRDTALQTVFWKIRYRDGRLKEFEFPIRTTPWGSIQAPADCAPPDLNMLDSPMLAHEPEALKIGDLPRLPKNETGAAS
ncbi:MAG: adenylyl-sulfate reductase subunit beta [Betaproteobacteria bacterium]|nr:adenylyl-sulfate reductase subunit beta [Betaproteobacteria bacterium]